MNPHIPRLENSSPPPSWDQGNEDPPGFFHGPQAVDGPPQFVVGSWLVVDLDVADALPQHAHLSGGPRARLCGGRFRVPVEEAKFERRCRSSGTQHK
jgi:hypothetical protein